MAQTVDTPLAPEDSVSENSVSEELSQDFTFAPSAHPPVSLPAGVRLLGTTATPPKLGFAPVPSASDGGPIAAGACAVPPAHLQRRFRLGLYDTAMLLLFLSCAALCCYRLLWAIQY